MPLYEYECSSCRRRVEELHGYNDQPEVSCPKCGSRCQKVMSKFMIHGTEAAQTFDYRISKAMRKAQDDRSMANLALGGRENPYESKEIIEPDVIDKDEEPTSGGEDEGNLE